MSGLRMGEEGVAADGGGSDGAALAEARIVVQGQVLLSLCYCQYERSCVRYSSTYTAKYHTPVPGTLIQL